MILWCSIGLLITYKKICPLIKKQNYVKRCTGIAGDTLEIRDGILVINNEIQKILIEELFNMLIGLSLKKIII